MDVQVCVRTIFALPSEEAFDFMIISISALHKFPHSSCEEDEVLFFVDSMAEISVNVLCLEACDLACSSQVPRTKIEKWRVLDLPGVQVFVLRSRWLKHTRTKFDLGSNDFSYELLSF